MKKTMVFGSVLFAAILMSCASRQPVIIPPPRIEPVVETETEMDLAMRQIKGNSPAVRKYFVLDEDRNIIVKGEIERFEVTYHMKHMQGDGSGGFVLPFSVESLARGEWRHDTLIWRPQRDVAGIMLAFDDDYFEVWESYFDLFDRYGARVTFFVQGEYCSFCTAALERGHDVGYHSLSHLNPLRISDEVFFEEALSQVEHFREAGVPIDSFAYPFGLFEPWMHEELLKHYKILSGYGVTFRAYDSATIRQGFISSRAIDTILFREDEDFEAEIDLMLRTIRFIGGDLILPLTSHDISDDADWGIKPRRLEYLLRSARDLHLNFYRFKDFIDNGLY